MKRLICVGLVCICCHGIQAQTPDTLKAIKHRPMTYGTDSVRSGTQTFQRGSGKTQGDTLAKARHSLKAGSSRAEAAK